MVKTTVYLDESDAAALRRLASQTGRSQAEIIREAVHTVTAPARRRVRVLKSAGVGRSSGEPIAEHADEILRREWPEYLAKRKLP
jgi:Arc/MetJ-type ribon-helix-helix transcriptional regulator